MPMPDHPKSRFLRPVAVPAAVHALFGLAALELHGQAGEDGIRPGVREIPARVLGDVPLSTPDSVVQRLVNRLDFDSYKELIRGLADFGDRQEGTEQPSDPGSPSLPYELDDVGGRGRAQVGRPYCYP